jgi:peptide/nickel transport system substrate-binding protein
MLHMVGRAPCKNLAIALQPCFASGVDAAILGPVEVRIDGRVVPLGGPKPRALLAIFLLHGNEVVSRDRLIDALWGERPPASVEQSLDTYVSRLRRALGGDRLLRRPGGYVLRIDPDELDLERFESLVRTARTTLAAGDAGKAAQMFRDALALWRGPALADVLYEPFASRESERLEERRLGAVEDLIEAQLAMGASAELVAELERLVDEHPLRERLLAQLMLALYRAGRHPEALAALQAARHRLVEELGLEPGPHLRELERQILQHDERLDAPRSPLREKRLQRRRAPAAAAALVLAAGAVAGIVLARGGSESSVPLADEASQLVAIGPHNGKPTKAIGLPGPPSAATIATGSIWVADSNSQTVLRVDPSRGVVDRIPIGGEPGSIASGDGAIWVASTLGGTIKRIDPATDTVTQTVSLGGANASALAIGQGGVWVADATDHALVELDAETGSARRTLTLDLSPSAVAIGRRSIWVAGYDVGKVEQIDLGSGQTVATVPVGQGPSALAVEGNTVWVANSLDSTVSRVDAITGSVGATIPVGSNPSGIAAAAGSVWVVNTYSGTVSRIDPRRNEVAATIRGGGRPTAVAAGPAGVWVGSGPRGESHRGGTLILMTTGPFPSIDPALQDASPLLTRLAYDTLVTFQAAPGPAGLRLVPDLALAVPNPGDGGRTYAFRLRPRIRYSDGRIVLAHDFRRSIERLFRLDSPGASLYAGVIGAASCLRHQARCDLSRGIVTDDADRTIVFHLQALDPDFLFKLTAVGFSVPIPDGTSDHDVGSKAVPGTGPYRIAGSNARELRLVRNRFFHEWSHAAQPAGEPDGIIWRFEVSSEKQVQAIEHGRADWTAALIPAAQRHTLRIRDPAQVRENPTFDIQFVSINTRRRPFNDVRVRQALNFAIDRARIARMYGAVGATPICQPLPAGFLGYRRYCPYTLHPRTDGRWTAPDVGRARALVKTSGTRGTRIDVWGATDLPGVARELPAYVAAVLRSLGYRTRLHLIPYAAFSPAMRERLQLSVDGDWLPDFPAPSSYLPAFFSCGGGNNRKHYVCEPRLDRLMQRASAAELQDPARAAALWTTIDRQLVDQAVWVPTVNVSEVEFVSKRVRNYQYQPVWGFLADQAWLR